MSYVPNEKYRNMFGVERSGYGMERVDLYLAQLEVAFKKIREDNRTLKRELSERELAERENPQPQYISVQAGEEANLLREQLVQQQQVAELAQQQTADLHQQVLVLQEQNRLLYEQAQVQAQPSEALLTQVSALRNEADELRRQLRQPAAATSSALEEDVHSVIGKVLVGARQQAEETLRTAQEQAEQVALEAHNYVEQLRGERDYVYGQLEEISVRLRKVLRSDEIAVAEIQ